MTKPFTVIGYWDDSDRRHVIGVIEGEHDVLGGEPPGEGGLFAELVEAETWEEAEQQTHGTTEDDEDEEPDFAFEELDDRFTKLPNPSDPSEADHWEHADAVKMPLNQVWTVVEGDSGSDWWAETGFHIVNKLFYVVTKEPWTDEDSGKNFRY